MRENEPSLFTRFGIYILIGVWVATAIVNAARGQVHYPEAFYVALIGFLLFAVAKISAIQKKPVSFGAASMTPAMGNLYRLGYWLMVVAALVMFA